MPMVPIKVNSHLTIIIKSLKTILHEILFTLRKHEIRYRRFIYMKKKVIILLLSFFSCKKSTPSVTLPPITETGANTFGCNVNGQVWVPYFRCFNGGNELIYNIQPIYNTSTLPIFISINAGNYANGETFFIFQQNSSYSDHIYGTGNIVDSLLIHFIASGTEYTNYQINPGQNSPRYLQISKLDTVNKILSGTFAFTLYGVIGINTLDSVVVTEGRFDLQLGNYSRCSP